MSTAKQKTPLHILRLSISNYGIIQAAAIDPDGNPIILAGDNGAGKSTVLNAIESVLFGRRMAEPVTKGKDKALLKLELAEVGETKPLYKIEQIIKKEKDGPVYAIKVLDAEGKQVPSPVKFIESLIASGAALDPTAIMQPRPGERPETFAKRQAETLMERFGLSKKAKALDAQIEAKAAERKSAKEKVDSLQAQLDAIEVPKGTPDAPLDVSDLAKRLTEMNNLDGERSKLADKVNSKKESLERAQKAYNDAEAAFNKAKEALAGAKKDLSDMESTAQEFEEMSPAAGIAAAVAEIQTKLSNANEINAAVQKKVQRKRLSAELSAAETLHNDADTELARIREERLELVRKAKLPVPGLTLTDEALLFNGKPLVQESTGNQIRVCSELAMAEEPDCRVIFLREGSLTNAANRKIIYESAIARGWQVWEEHFSEQPMDGALWIEGGKVEA